MDNQIIPADKNLRKRLLICLILFVLLGLVGNRFLSHCLTEIKSLVDTNPDLALAEVKRLITVVTVANALISSAFATYFITVAIEILKSRRYPPEGMRVIRDTRLRTGGQARIMAIAHFAVALILLATNLLMARASALLEGLLRK